MARDISKTRVHVVEEPYTPYIVWEIKCYRHGHKGEDIFLTSKGKLGSIKVPGGDFWIFDDSSAVEFIYEGLHGKSVGGYIYPSGSDISHLRAVKKEVLGYGVRIDQV